MLFTKSSKWKKFLSSTDEDILNKFLEKVSEYRPSYKNADQIKIAQLWCALLALRKENKNLNSRLKRLENILDSITKGDEKEKEELMESLKKF